MSQRSSGPAGPGGRCPAWTPARLDILPLRSGDLPAALTPGRALAALRHAPDAVARQRASLEFWDVIVDGADSITFRLMYNGLRAAYEPVLTALAPLLDAELSRHDAYERLAAVITKGQPTNARRAADDLLRPGSLSLLAALDALEAP